MAFMIPQYEHVHQWDQWSEVYTVSGEVLIAPFGVLPAEVVEESEIESIRSALGWFCRLSAPGYMDCTDWSGPYETENEAREAIVEMYDVDPDSGDEI